MPIHVFIGAGPANLHRALKVRKLNPNAQILILDHRLNPVNPSLDREQSRANIFRFEREDVTEKLIADGVDRRALFKLMHQRNFSVKQGFQQGDDDVFAAKPFSQIQIRDIQQLLLDTLYQQGHIRLINQNIDLEASVVEQIIDFLEDLNLTDTEIQIHVATGTLQGNSKRHEIIYPDKKTYQMENASPDIQAMSVIPVHGTATFFIKDQFNKKIISCAVLERNQRSLDLTAWQGSLEQFGWNLIRPPRIRVFYANDILYIGSEIPRSMMNIINKREFEEKVTDYTRKIAELVFPNLPIKDLKANEVLRSRFPTGRGECGEVITSKIVDLPDHQKATITIFNNGDSRYLPHYQTGSGFVTGFLQNEIYAEIYQYQQFDDLFAWAHEKKHIDKSKNVSQLRKQYERLTKTQDEKTNLSAFQQELYMALTRDIIEENKQKVGRYFNALHQQTLTLLPNHFEEFLDQFKKNASSSLILPLKINEETDKTVAILAMLKTDNIAFLSKILPRLLNDDINQLSDERLLNLRNAYIDDLKRNLPLELIKKFNHFERQSLFLIKLSKFNFNEILANYNRIYETTYQDYNFPEENRLITLVEMLNCASNMEGINFLSFILGKLVNTNVYQYSDDAILNLRDELTKNYIDYIDVDYITRMIRAHINPKFLNHHWTVFQTKELSYEEIQIRLIAALAQKDNTRVVESIIKNLSLPVIAKKEDKQALGLRWAKTLLAEKINHPIQGHSIDEGIYKLLQCSHKEELAKRLNRIRGTLTEHRELYSNTTTSYLFFRWQQNNMISEFINSLNQLISKNTTKENLQLNALDLLVNFHDKLKSRYSLRALVILTDAINNQPEYPENNFTNAATL